MDYNVVMQIFRYIAFIWEDFEKEDELSVIMMINKLQRAADFAEQVKERKKTIEEAIEKLIKVLRNMNVEEEIIKAQLKEQYNLP